jgi:1,6-anhydro-N-acetylmuramate kinase
MADLFTGLMSGTSMDDIDAILYNCSCKPPEILATQDRKYNPDILQQIGESLILEGQPAAANSPNRRGNR